MLGKNFAAVMPLVPKTNCLWCRSCVFKDSFHMEKSSDKRRYYCKCNFTLQRVAGLARNESLYICLILRSVDRAQSICSGDLLLYKHTRARARERVVLACFTKPCRESCAKRHCNRLDISNYIASCWWSRHWGTGKTHINACAISIRIFIAVSTGESFFFFCSKAYLLYYHFWDSSSTSGNQGTRNKKGKDFLLPVCLHTNLLSLLCIRRRIQQ